MVKIDIIGGFLGAGKTTLINKLMREGLCCEKIAILENEFGDVNVDSDLIENTEVKIRELTSGCICCTLQGDLVEGICEIAGEVKPDRILIEPTGAANMGDILKACYRAEEKADVRVNMVLTVVNAECMIPLLEVGGDFFQKQIREAEYIVLSCVQNCTEEELREVRMRIRELNDHVPVEDRNWEDFDGMLLVQMAEEAAQADALTEKAQDTGEKSKELPPMMRVEGRKKRVLRGDLESIAYAPGYDYTQDKVLDILQSFQSQECGLVLRAKGFLEILGKICRVEFVYGKYEIAETNYTGNPKFVVIGKYLKREKLNQFFGEAL